MTETDRDTRFIGFATLQLNELVQRHLDDIPRTYRFWEQMKEEIEILLAQRAYDLVMHTIGSLDAYAYDTAVSSSALIENVPDLVVLPSEGWTND